MKINITPNNKLIILLIIISVVFAGILALLYFTFGNSSLNNKNEVEVEKTLISSQIKTAKTFETNDVIGQNISSQSQTVIPKPETNTSEIVSIATTLIQSSSNLYSDIINKDLKLPESQKISYSFDSKDKEIISKYIKTDYQNKIVSMLEDDKNSEIIALKIPLDKIDSLTQKDFPNTFRFSNEDREPIPKDKIFLYYTSEKRIAYLGEYINDIHAFQYESQDYWLVHYNTELLISKPNFSNWIIIDLQNDPVQAMNKKSDFEFEILRQVETPDTLEYNIETISPQKFIIDGIFENKGEN
jgi:flagellar basal body-associated protein FliL